MDHLKSSKCWWGLHWQLALLSSLNFTQDSLLKFVGISPIDYWHVDVHCLHKHCVVPSNRRCGPVCLVRGTITTAFMWILPLRRDCRLCKVDIVHKVNILCVFSAASCKATMAGARYHLLFQENKCTPPSTLGHVGNGWDFNVKHWKASKEKQGQPENNVVQLDLWAVKNIPHRPFFLTFTALLELFFKLCHSAAGYSTGQQVHKVSAADSSSLDEQTLWNRIRSGSRQPQTWGLYGIHKHLPRASF